MFSEQFFDLLLNFGDDWKVDDVKVNFKLEEVDIYVSYISDNAECPDSMELCRACRFSHGFISLNFGFVSILRTFLV